MIHEYPKNDLFWCMGTLFWSRFFVFWVPIAIFWGYRYSNGYHQGYPSNPKNAKNPRFYFPSNKKHQHKFGYPSKKWAILSCCAILFACFGAVFCDFRPKFCEITCNRSQKMREWRCPEGQGTRVNGYPSKIPVSLTWSLTIYQTIRKIVFIIPHLTV